MTRAFVDTSAFIALLDADDPGRDAARTTLIALADHDLVTTGYVVAESVAVLRRRFRAGRRDHARGRSPAARGRRAG